MGKNDRSKKQIQQRYRHKFNTKKSVVFLYTNINNSKKEVKKLILLIIEKNKILRENQRLVLCRLKKFKEITESIH